MVSYHHVSNGISDGDRGGCWYVLNWTDSPLLAGLTATARLGFNFLALFAGATADLVSRRTLMIIVQAVLASLPV